MFDLSDICSLCLVLSENLQNVLNHDSDGTVIENKLRVFLLELVNFKPNVSKYICKDCLETVNNVHKFREKCLKNISVLNKYVEKSEASSSQQSCSNSQENSLDDNFVTILEQKHVIDTLNVTYEEFEDCTEENVNNNKNVEEAINSENSTSSSKQSSKKAKKRKHCESFAFSETSNLDLIENSSLLNKKSKNRDSTQEISNFIDVNGGKLFVTQQSSTQFNDFAENFIINPLEEDNSESNAVPTNESAKDMSIDLIMRNQMQIEAKLMNLNKTLDTILKTNIPSVKLPESLLEQLPLKTFEAFLSFENYLTNETNFQDMISYCKGMCSSNLGKSLNEILRELFTNKLAMEFNYCGKKPKNKFNGTKTDKLLYFTARHTFQCSFQEYKEQTMKWLKYAPQREKYIKMSRSQH